MYFTGVDFNSTFTFFEIENGGSQGIGLGGHYKTRNDSLILTSDRGRVMKIFKAMLFNYPDSGVYFAVAAALLQ